MWVLINVKMPVYFCYKSHILLQQIGLSFDAAFESKYWNKEILHMSIYTEQMLIKKKKVYVCVVTHSLIYFFFSIDNNLEKCKRNTYKHFNRKDIKSCGKSSTLPL